MPGGKKQENRQHFDITQSPLFVVLIDLHGKGMNGITKKIEGKALGIEEHQIGSFLTIQLDKQPQWIQMLK